MEKRKMAKMSKISEMRPSPIRKMFEMSIGMSDVVNFSLGEPNFVTPENIREAAVASIRRGDTHYDSNAGMKELREAVARKLKEYDKVSYDPDEVVITASGMEAIYLTMLAILDPGDEIIVSDPCYVNYMDQARMVGATPVCVPVREENGFNFDLNELESAITSKTKAIMINSPMNPTGGVATKEILEGIAKLAQKYDIFVVFDEVYKYLLYDGLEFFDIARFSGMKERTIIVDSFSKTYAMTGWRVGYIASSAAIAGKIPKIHEEILCCVPTFTQYACIEALTNGDDSIRKMNASYAERRDLIYKGINQIKGLSCIKPNGAFYVFMNIKQTGMTSEEFSMSLLRDVGVVTSPGSGFGRSGEGYVRLSYATSKENIEEGLKRVARFMKQHQTD